LLVERGLFESRARAQAAIEAGLVTADDKRVLKPSENHCRRRGVAGAAGASLCLARRRQAGRRAGAISDRNRGSRLPRRRRIDRRLHRGACSPTAPAWCSPSTSGAANCIHRCAAIPRSFPWKETDIRDFEGKRLPARPDVVVIDVSFISLKAVLPVALSLAAAPMHLLALIKPQFEAPRKHSKRGIIRNAMVHQEICDDIAAFAASLGCTGIQVFPSSIKGGDGNIEFFIGARRG
jgi:23S rRNA (cytidine1920-2'-O)/16S rRNA (cytidine1409-2'-O)-methyltransferase